MNKYPKWNYFSSHTTNVLSLFQLNSAPHSTVILDMHPEGAKEWTKYFRLWWRKIIKKKDKHYCKIRVLRKMKKSAYTFLNAVTRWIWLSLILTSSCTLREKVDKDQIYPIFILNLWQLFFSILVKMPMSPILKVYIMTVLRTFLMS